MKTFKFLSESMKKVHYGTCVDSFYPSSGNRKNTKGCVPYRDVSDFAHAITGDNGTNKNEHKISKEEFLKHAHVDPKHEHILNDKSTEFLHNKERDSHIMYDAKKDVHHFYEHT